jgi:hypothetical protein
VTIVVRGLGRDIDSFGSQVAFGLTIEHAESAPISEVVNTSIEQWYVIDYRQRVRRPVNAKEWEILRGIFVVWKRSRAKAIRDTREHQALMKRFAKGLTPRRTAGDLYVRKTHRHLRDVRASVRPRNAGRKGA